MQNMHLCLYKIFFIVNLSDLRKYNVAGMSKRRVLKNNVEAVGKHLDRTSWKEWLDDWVGCHSHTSLGLLTQVWVAWMKNTHAVRLRIWRWRCVQILYPSIYVELAIKCIKFEFAYVKQLTSVQTYLNHLKNTAIILKTYYIYRLFELPINKNF